MAAEPVCEDDLPIEGLAKGVPGSPIDVCRRIVANRTAEEHDGVAIDMQSANCLVTIHDALSPTNQAKLAAMSVPRACDVAWKVYGRQSKS